MSKMKLKKGKIFIVLSIIFLSSLILYYGIRLVYYYNLMH